MNDKITAKRNQMIKELRNQILFGMAKLKSSSQILLLGDAHIFIWILFDFVTKKMAKKNDNNVLTLEATSHFTPLYTFIHFLHFI